MHSTLLNQFTITSNNSSKLHVTIKQIVLLTLLLLGSFYANAQEPLMAKGNKTFGISYGITNFNRVTLNNYVANQNVGNYSMNASIHYSNPLVLTFDMALSDYTTVGIGVGYYNFNLKQFRANAIDTFDLHTSGHRFTLQARIIRYFVQRPRSVFYLFGGVGARFRSVTYNTSDSLVLHLADIHHAADADPDGFFPVSINAGIGFKFLLSRRIGFMSEWGVTTGIGQLGIFYSFKNKWRRTNDNIGW